MLVTGSVTSLAGLALIFSVLENRIIVSAILPVLLFAVGLLFLYRHYRSWCNDTHRFPYGTVERG